MRHSAILAAAAFSLAIGGPLAGCLNVGGANTACTVEVCQTLNACQASPKGSIGRNSCGPLPLSGDDPAFNDAGAVYCVMACNQDNLSALFDCVSNHFSATTCADIAADGGSPFQAIAGVCERSAGSDAGGASPVSSLNAASDSCQAGVDSCNPCQEQCDYIADQCD